jgi:hypothetical protein
VAAARRRDTAVAGFEAGEAQLAATNIFSPDLTPKPKRTSRPPYQLPSPPRARWAEEIQVPVDRIRRRRRRI